MKFPRNLLPSWSIRNWIGIALLAALIIGAVSAIGWWNSWKLPSWSSEDRFEYFNGPTVLLEVKEIGQLVGAEYYGEVVHSWLEHQESNDWSRLTEVFTEVKNIYTRQYNAAKAMPIRRGETEIRMDAQNRFIQSVATLSDKGWYLNVIAKLSEDQKRQLEEIRTSEWEDFATKHRTELLRLRREYRQGTMQNPALIYLGRGEVLVGYDLKTITPEQMIRQGDTLILQDLNPIVISAAINPWYLAPEDDSAKKGIPGFESLREEGSVTRDMVKQVKAGCKEDLVREAFANGIGQLAEASAEATLLSFFNLLVKPEESLSMVDIRPSPQYEQIERWAADGRISKVELPRVKAAIKADSTSASWLPILQSRIGRWGNDPDWAYVR
ncbi:MAG: hypothetical protein NWR72_04220 [Bacteroidia bacterium]|nr:hypothetical protein [Bacteroidia bacterium]